MIICPVEFCGERNFKILRHRKRMTDLYERWRELIQALRNAIEKNRNESEITTRMLSPELAL